jgi:hypothetical protein
MPKKNHQTNWEPKPRTHLEKRREMDRGNRYSEQERFFGFQCSDAYEWTDKIEKKSLPCPSYQEHTRRKKALKGGFEAWLSQVEEWGRGGRG